MIQLLLPLFLSFILNSFSQVRTISGEVIDIHTKENLGYVNIGIPYKGVGTVSNSKGEFLIKLNEHINKNDTLYFSHIGYKTKKIVLSQLKPRDNIIELVPETQQLDEVIVSLKEPKFKRFGRSSKGLGLLHSNFYSSYEKEVDDRLSKEMGMKFKAKKDCKISDLNFHITTNDFKSLKFRINFYNIENGLPADIIVDKDIIFEIKDNFTGWHKVDLEAYDIYVDKDLEEFAVTIQWVESVKAKESSKYFALSVAKSLENDFLYREKTMDRWNKSGMSLSFYLNSMCQ